jgi:hypothetical protein
LKFNIYIGMGLINFHDQADMIWFYGQVGVLVFLIVYLIFIFQSANKSEADSQKEIFHGFAGFIISNIGNQTMFLIHTIYDRNNSSDLLPRVIRIGGTGYEFLMLIFFAIGFYFLMKPIEKYLLQKEKLRITALNMTSFVVLLTIYIGSLLYHEGVWEDYWTYIAFVGVGIFGFSALFSMFGSFLFYLRLGIKSTGIIRKKGFLIGFGIIFLYIGILVGTSLDDWMSIVFGPGIMIVGGIMVLIGHKIELM